MMVSGCTVSWLKGGRTRAGGGARFKSGTEIGAGNGRTGTGGGRLGSGGGGRIGSGNGDGDGGRRRGSRPGRRLCPNSGRSQVADRHFSK